MVTVPAIGRLAAGLTMLVVSSLMTVLAPTPAPAAAATPALLVSVSAGEQTPCRDVFFLGARGSGESGTEKWGLGGTVLPTLNWYRNGVSGLGVAIAGVRYPANPVPFNPLKARAYFRGVSDGVTAAMAEVKERHSWCPRERIAGARRLPQDQLAESGCVRRRAADPATSHRTAVGGLDPDRRRG